MSIIVYVEAGEVQSVFCDSETNIPEVLVVDYDTRNGEDPTVKNVAVEYMDPECEIAKDIQKWRL